MATGPAGGGATRSSTGGLSEMKVWNVKGWTRGVYPAFLSRSTT